MIRIFPVLLAVILMYVNPVPAREGGGHHRGHNGASGGEHGSHGMTAGEHMSERGLENLNAQWSSGATSGQDRSALRKQGHGKHGSGVEGGDHQGKARHHDHQGDMGAAGTIKARKVRTRGIRRIKIQAARALILIDYGQKA